MQVVEKLARWLGQHHGYELARDVRNFAKALLERSGKGGQQSCDL